MVSQERFTVSTRGPRDMHDLTARVAAVVARSEVRAGLAHVFHLGSTAAVGLIEFEPGLQEDLPAILALLQESMGRASDPRFEALFRWKHLENAFGRSPMWVACDGDRVVGLVAIHARRLAGLAGRAHGERAAV